MDDSDDWLKVSVVEKICSETKNFTKDFNLLSFLKVYEDNKIIGDVFPNDLDTYLDCVNRNIADDKADVLRKDALKGFFFPKYFSENFMSEMLLFLWVAGNGKTHFINFPGYICEYLEDGLSANSVYNRHRCVNSTLFVYQKKYNTHKNLKLKSRAAINWWRFRFFKSITKNAFKAPIIYSPFGFSLYLFIYLIKCKVLLQ